MEISKLTTPKEWTYFSKGNANILFKYNGQNDFLAHKLLRVRLDKTATTEGYISTCQLYDFIELKCKPLFPQETLEIQLVILTTSFINSLDTRGNAIMMSEKYGLILPNLLDGDFTMNQLSKNCILYKQFENQKIRSVILEIKPKWLYHNKTNYCRNCSLNQYKNFERHFCSLDFLYPDTIDKGIEDLFSKVSPGEMDQIQSEIPIKKLFQQYLSTKDNFFLKLQKLQNMNDTNFDSINSENDVSSNLSLVMTLRDLGLFIRFEKYHENSPNDLKYNSDSKVFEINGERFIIHCNIVDLDLKSNSKYKHWIQIEAELQKYYNSTNKKWVFCAKS